MTTPRILTFPCAETILAPLADLDASVELAVPSRTIARHPWLLVRALPPRVQPVPWTVERASRLRRDYDLVICHTLDELADVRAADQSMPVVLHANPPYEAMFGRGADEVLRVLDASTTCVFDGVARRDAWPGVDGVIIPAGVDVSSYGPYAGDDTSVLVGGHLLTELPLRSGYSVLERITAGLPVAALGFNPALGQSRIVTPRRERLACYGRHRLYLNTAVGPFADAANAWVIEAMASGMPVVTLADPATPVEHGASGLVADDPTTARLHVMELLEDHDLAVRLGCAARESIERRYPVERARSAWAALIDSVVLPATRIVGAA